MRMNIFSPSEVFTTVVSDEKIRSVTDPVVEALLQEGDIPDAVKAIIRPIRQEVALRQWIIDSEELDQEVAADIQAECWDLLDAESTLLMLSSNPIVQDFYKKRD